MKNGKTMLSILLVLAALVLSACGGSAGESDADIAATCSEWLGLDERFGASSFYDALVS